MRNSSSYIRTTKRQFRKIFNISSLKSISYRVSYKFFYLYLLTKNAINQSISKINPNNINIVTIPTIACLNIITSGLYTNAVEIDIKNNIDNKLQKHLVILFLFINYYFDIIY